MSKVTWERWKRPLFWTLEDRVRRGGWGEIPDWRTMSPLVQRTRVLKRAATAQRANSNGNSADQHWSMLIFESMSAGVMALLVLMMALMLLVGVYVIIVWPLTLWDLPVQNLDGYSSWVSMVLWSVFAGGSLAGLWCFSGAAFKDKKKARRNSSRV
jgi:hypothetical protein